MKKSTLLKLSATVLAALSLTAAVSAKGFTKTNEYTEGKFTDVPEKQWYATEVKSAYELGFMNGQSDTLFAPDGNVTVAEGITMASRVHSIYNGKEIKSVEGGKWYDMYIAYAKENGLVADGQFTNFDRNIMRYEMAVMFANAMPAEYFAAKNDIKDIPDVAETEEYYDDLMMLYKAGVVLGSDDYGNFYATNPIKRSETAAIINRVALPENRKEGKLAEYGDRDQAVFLIEDYSFGKAPHSGTYFGSGWLVEDLGSSAFNEVGSIKPVLTDDSDKRVIYAHRDVKVQTKGKVMTELNFSVAGSGSKFMFKDSDGKVFAELVHKNAKLFFISDKEYDLGISLTGGAVWAYTELDLDNDTMYIAIDGVEVGTYPLNPVKDLATLTAGTTKELEGTLSMGAVHMWVNYDVFDVFRTNKEGKAPFGWSVEGNVKTTPVDTSSTYDVIGVAITDAGKMTKKFAPVTDKFVYETFLLVPEGQPAYVALYNGEKEAVKVTASADGKFVSQGKELRKFNNAVWQQVRVEADTAANTALIKINGKKTQTVAFNEDAVDSIVIAFEGKGTMLVDDAELYNVFDYADYVPTPVPVTDDEWIVGMSVCSLWREGTHYGWYCIDGYEENQPVLGYYDEGLPEVADWEIKFLAEHGYDFQHYCWYLGTQGKAPIKNTRLASAILDGYFNAKYSDMCDMMIMWENAGCNYKSPEFFYDYVWPYWCEWYFSDDRYLRIDNKAPLTIYRYGKFIENMGGEEGAKKAIEFMREDIKKLGYDDMIIFFTDRGANADTNKKMKNVGADALLSYTFGENAYSSKYQFDCMNSAFNAGTLSLLPCIGVGFNDIGWTEERTPYATAEEHKAVMEWAKSDYLPRIEAREGKEWMGKFVFHTTWNEYGEGHYIMPANLNKFGYVDANRAVFSSVAGKDDSKHFDIEPTDNQKARLGYLYAGTHTSMRKLQLADGGASSIANNEPVYVFNFENKDECSLWSSMMNCTYPVYDEAEKALVAATTTKDGAIKNVIMEAIAIDADEAKYCRIVMKHEKGSASGNLFFKQSGDKDWTSAKGFAFNCQSENGEYAEIIIDLTKNSYWNGTIKELRFDPCDDVQKFYIKSIEFLSNRSKDAFTIDVDSYKMSFPKERYTKVGDEVFVAGNPSEGFYSLQNMYYKWNRFTGKLIVKAHTGTTFEFNVGSDKALVDGKEMTLASKIELYDGLVKVPVMFIYKNAGVEYKTNERGVEITVRDKSIKEALTSRVENQWEFNVANDLEGWTITCGQGAVTGGNIFFTASPVSSTKTGFDPQISIKSVSFPAEYYNKCQIRVRPTFDDENTSDNQLTVYFATSLEAGLSESKTVRANLNNLTPDAEGYYNIELDMTTNEKWTGNINTLRIDPTNRPGYYEIDYVRMIVDPEMEAKVEAAAKEKAEQLMLLMAADEGKPFYIKNPDAESITGNHDATSGNCEVSIVEDDEKQGNKAYLLTPTVSSKKSWSYFIVPTRFKPGVKYRIDVDIKAVSDQNGNPVTNGTFVVNFRYTDKDSSGNFKTMMDHPLNDARVTASTVDGWVHLTCEHTISEASIDRSNDFFTIFANPQGDDTNPINMSYMVDNIVVTVVE